MNPLLKQKTIKIETHPTTPHRDHRANIRM